MAGVVFVQGDPDLLEVLKGAGLVVDPVADRGDLQAAMIVLGAAGSLVSLAQGPRTLRDLLEQLSAHWRPAASGEGQITVRRQIGDEELVVAFGPQADLDLVRETIDAFISRTD